MPPLAVVGFGVATSNLAITKGAFMLFMTNLLAISLSVTILARFYGFDQTRSPKRTAFQMSFAVMIFLALSMPLGVALKDIAYQTYVTKVAQNLIKDYFEKDNSRTSVFNIKFSPNKKASIDTVVLTQNYQAKAQDDIQKAITDALGGDINLSLDQIVVAHEVIEQSDNKAKSDNTIAPVLTPQNTELARIGDMQNNIKQSAYFPIDHINVDMEKKSAGIYPKYTNRANIFTLRQFETELKERYPDWSIDVVPPQQALPYVLFEHGMNKISAEEHAKIEDIIWTLNKWNIHKVTAVGILNSIGEINKFGKESMSYLRVQKVLEMLKNAGIEVEISAEYYKNPQSKNTSPVNRTAHKVEIRLSEQMGSSY